MRWLFLIVEPSYSKLISNKLKRERVILSRQEDARARVHMAIGAFIFVAPLSILASWLPKMSLTSQIILVLLFLLLEFALLVCYGKFMTSRSNSEKTQSGMDRHEELYRQIKNLEHAMDDPKKPSV